MDIEMQLKLNICQLVNTGKQSWQKEKKKKNEKKKKSEYCKLRSSPRSCNLAFFLQNKSLRGNWSQLEGVTHFAYWTNTKWTEIITYLWGFYRIQTRLRV